MEVSMNGRTIGSKVKMNLIVSGISVFLVEDVPTIIMAMSIALTNHYQAKGYYFTSIDFSKCDNDEDGYYLPFKATVSESFGGNVAIESLNLEGKIHLNHMLQNPTEGCVSFTEVK